MQIEVKPRDKVHFELYCEGELFAVIHKSIFGKAPKFSKQFSNSDEFKELFFKKEKEGARNFLARSLGKKNLHSLQAEKKLKDLKVSYDTISHVISEFLDKEYLEDKKFIEAFVSMHERQGRGPYWISQKLKAIGVLEEEFSAYFSSSKESLRELFEKKTVKLDLKDPKIKRKLIAFFLRRGFSFEEILEVLAQDDYGSATKRF